MKYTILTILLFTLLTSCGNAQKKDNQIESEYVFKKDFCKDIVVGGVVGIENKCYKINDVITGTLQSNDNIKVRLRPYVNENETGLTQDEINNKRRLSSQEFIEIPIDYLTLKKENKVENETFKIIPKGKSLKGKMLYHTDQKVTSLLLPFCKTGYCLSCSVEKIDIEAYINISNIYDNIIYLKNSKDTPNYTPNQSGEEYTTVYFPSTELSSLYEVIIPDTMNLWDQEKHITYKTAKDVFEAGWVGIPHYTSKQAIKVKINNAKIVKHEGSYGDGNTYTYITIGVDNISQITFYKDENGILTEMKKSINYINSEK